MEIKYRSFKRELGVDPEGLPPQIVVWEGEIRRWRSGYWAGRIFNGVDSLYCCSEKTQRKNKVSFYEVEALGKLFKCMSALSKEEFKLAFMKNSARENLLLHKVFDLFYMENQGKMHFEDFIESLSDSVHHPAALLNDKTNANVQPSPRREADREVADPLADANVQPCSGGIPKFNQKVEGLITSREVAERLASRAKSRASSTKPYPPETASLLDNAKELGENLERLALQYEAMTIRKKAKVKKLWKLIEKGVYSDISKKLALG